MKLLLTLQRGETLHGVHHLLFKHRVRLDFPHAVRSTEVPELSGTPEFNLVEPNGSIDCIHSTRILWDIVPTSPNGSHLFLLANTSTGVNVINHRIID